MEKKRNHLNWVKIKLKNIYNLNYCKVWIKTKGTRGQYDASDDRFIEKLNQEHKARAIKIDALNELKFATDYMTQQEMVWLFFIKSDFS